MNETDPPTLNETTLNRRREAYRTDEVGPSPVGELTLVADDTALRQILFPPRNPHRIPSPSSTSNAN